MKPKLNVHLELRVHINIVNLRKFDERTNAYFEIKSNTVSGINNIARSLHVTNFQKAIDITLEKFSIQNIK